MQKIYFIGTNKISGFYELWHKQLKIMEMTQGRTDTYDDGYKDQFQPGTTHKIH